MIPMKLPAKPKHAGVKSVLYPVLFGVLLMVLWQTQVLHKLLHTTTLILPLPGKIVSVLAGNAPAVWQNTQVTLAVLLPGLAIGSLIGYGLSVLASHSPRFGATGLTVIAAVSAVPIVALSAVMLQWTRNVSTDVGTRSYVMKLLIVVIVSIASMTLNAYRGLTELPPYALDLMKTLAAGRWAVLIKLRAPNSVPFVFTALKVSVPAGVMAALVSEYFAEKVSGVGRMIRENILKAQYAAAWAYIAVACLLGIAMYAVLMAVEHLVMKKRHAFL